MPDSNQQKPQGQEAEISVDLSQSDTSKAVTRTRGSLAPEREDRRPRTSTDTKAMRKRLGRMERSFEQRRADDEARHQRELSDLRKDMDKLRVERTGSNATQLDAEHDRAMAAFQAQLEAAIEKGDSKEQAKITVAMQRADGEYWAAKAKVAGATTREETRTDTRTERAPIEEGRKVAGPTAAGSRFILANEDWWEDPEFSIEKAAAGTIYAELIQPVDKGGQYGMDANSDATFRAVAKRLKAKFPDLEVIGGKPKPGDDDDDDDDDEADGTDEVARRRETRRAAAGSYQDRGEANARRPNTRTLTAADKATMRAMQLDPNNDKHVVQWVREQQAEAEAGAA